MPTEANTEADGSAGVPPIDGAAVAAILLMLLEENEAASILKHFEPDEVLTIGRAMFAAAEASEGQIENALDRFVTSSRQISTLAVRADPRIRSVMFQALGNIRADNILAEIAPQSSAAALDILRWMEVPTIANILANEHPQVGAIILAVLTPEVAGAVLEGLDESAQTDLVVRAARLKSVSADAIADLEIIFERASAVKAGKPKLKLGGASEVARIVNSLKKPTGERVLRTIKKRDKQLGQDIEDEMFIFDNLLELDAKSLGAVLRAVDSGSLGLALKGASEALVDKMLGSMSARAAQSIRDDMADRGLVKRAEVEEAQKVIIAEARKLAEAGEITLGAKGDDYV
ncbi:MAG: flagellar motor switch protein FliG [Pseudomonadota bacterium]